MKLILFRPTFVTAGTTFQTIALLCIFLSITSGKSLPFLPFHVSLVQFTLTRRWSL